MLVITHRIPLCPPAIGGIIVAEVVVDESKLGIIHLAAPLDALSDFRGVGGYANSTVGGVSVGGPYGSAACVELTDVLR